MSLLNLWTNSRQEIETKHISQILAVAGTGKLSDSNQTSLELREYLTVVSSDLLSRYANDCLEDSFQDRGFILQDIVNEMGRRLGFKVQNGRYRGTISDIGFDGLWLLPNEKIIVIEVKVSDAYSIDINTTIDYRNKLQSENTIPRGEGSILYVVGRSDTSAFESQIRGSRYAWDVRLISVDALLKLLSIKKEIDDPYVIEQIANILIPKEYTRLDRIIDLVFYTTQDVKVESVLHSEDDDDDKQEPAVDFRQECIERISDHLNKHLIQVSKTIYQSSDSSVVVSCAVSKLYDDRSGGRYWFAFHPSQLNHLEKSDIGYVSFGCGSSEMTLLIPFEDFQKWLDKLFQTISETRQYWHVHIVQKENSLILSTSKDYSNINVTKYLISKK